MKDLRYFSKDWLVDPAFKDWVVNVPETTEARCRICCKTFKLSNMGRQALVSHASGKCHKTHFDRKQIFFKPKPARAAKPQSTNSSNVDSASTSSKSDTIIVNNEPRIDLMLQSSQKQKADIVWAIKVVCSSYSNNSCFDVSQVFKCMFPDSEIAKSFELGADKLKYVINFGLAPYFKDMLGELKTAKWTYLLDFLIPSPSKLKYVT